MRLLILHTHSPNHVMRILLCPTLSSNEGAPRNARGDEVSVKASQQFDLQSLPCLVPSRLRVILPHCSIMVMPIWTCVCSCPCSFGEILRQGSSETNAEEMRARTSTKNTQVKVTSAHRFGAVAPCFEVYQGSKYQHNEASETRFSKEVATFGSGTWILWGALPPGIYISEHKGQKGAGKSQLEGFMGSSFRFGTQGCKGTLRLILGCPLGFSQKNVDAAVDLN